MTSWMECGCGGDVTLYEGVEERFGRKWHMFAGNCKVCGMYHEVVSAGEREEYDRLKEEYEQAQEEAERMDGIYKGQVGTITLCEDEDRETCIAKLMAKVWRNYQPNFWLTRNGRVEIQWTYREADNDGWFNFHLIVKRWYPTNGGDDAEQYTEEYCLQNLNQVMKYLHTGRIVEWTLIKRGHDHKSMTYSGYLPKGGLEQLMEVFV